MDSRKKVIALGFFDGVHSGHARLLDCAANTAKRIGASSAVLTFDSHPEELVAGHFVPLITSPDERALIMRRNFNIDEVIVVHFDDELRRMHWEDFVLWLVRDFSAVHFIAGHDFRFGFMGQGTTELLRKKCELIGIGCDIIPKVTKDDITVSSTYIRSLLLEGNIRKANEFLGHPHSLSDIVRYGYRIGTKLGIPTINMRFPENVLIPAHGVYASSLLIEGDPLTHYAVTNIGIRPTIANDEKVSVESYILDFNRAVYGKHVRLEFHDFLRPEIKFSSISELTARIKADADSVKRILENTI